MMDRNVPYAPVYSALTSLLGVDDLGIKVVRPGACSLLGRYGSDAYVFGYLCWNYRSKEVVFSYNIGEVTSADYLWSNKTLKNSAFVSGNGYKRL